MNKLFILIAAAALAVAGLTTASAQTATNATPARFGMRHRLAEKLNLTDDQKSQIKSVLAGEKDTLTTLLSQWHEARVTLRTAIHAPDANETAVRAASAKVASAEGDLAVERMKIYGKISPILTEEQRQQIADLEQRMDNLADGLITRMSERLGN